MRTLRSFIPLLFFPFTATPRDNERTQTGKIWNGKEDEGIKEEKFHLEKTKDGSRIGHLVISKHTGRNGARRARIHPFVPLGCLQRAGVRCGIYPYVGDIGNRGQATTLLNR